MRTKVLLLMIAINCVGVLANAKPNLRILGEQLNCQSKIDWPAFMRNQDIVWERLPSRWEEAPYLGNGNIGTMVYLDKKKNALRLQLFRLDVQDHRDNSYGWTAYSRPRFMIGSFYIKPAGKMLGAKWRLDLWNATLSGQIETERGVNEFEHLVHTDDMVVHTEIKSAKGETWNWQWKPEKAETTRGGYPRNVQEKQQFAKRYGMHHLDTLKLYKPNPQCIQEVRDGVKVSIQNLLAGGQYAVAWQQMPLSENAARHVLSIEKSYPETTAAHDAVANVKRVANADVATWLATHRKWWNDYYPASFVSLPDIRLENFYWHQIYKMACATRNDRPMMDTAGPWIQSTPWPYVTTDLNVQLCYWPVCPANRLHLGESLINTFHKNRQNLIDNVRPKEWQVDSAYLATTCAQDLIEPRDGDMRYYNAVGHLTWVMHNCWLQYRFSMDDEMLREKIYPLLKRSINFYRHMLLEGEDGKLHLPPTYSPETKEVADCNYDLALLRWGCQTLLQASKRLNIEDPLIPEWKNIVNRLVDFPVDNNGFMIGAAAPWDLSHRHYSHLLMVYPLYLVNVDQQPDQRELIEKSLKHWSGFKGALAGYSYTGASSISSALGNGNDALKYLNGLSRFLLPNGLYKEAGPVMETPLSAAQCIHDMLLQSWGDTIRVFPAAPDDWSDITFHDLRTQGAFLVSAVRKRGKTQFVRIKSLAGEPCQIQTDLDGKVQASGCREFTLNKVQRNRIEVDLKKSEEIFLWIGDSAPDFLIEALPVTAGRENCFGLRKKN